MSKLIVTPLEELTLYINRGVAPAYIEDSSEASISVVNQKCIRDGQVNFGYARRHNELKRRVPEEKLLQKFDVLVNSTGTGTVGRVAQVLDGQKATVDTHVTIVRPDKTKVDLRYFGHLLEWHQKELESLAEGSSNQVELSRDKIAHLRIPVIPKPSQHLVADILDASNNAILATQKVIDQTEKFKKSLLQKIFVENSYQTIKLAETGSNIQYGYTASATAENTGVKMLRITDVQNGTVDWDNVPYCECPLESFNKYKLRQGDIVFARTGATTGKSYRITENQDSVFASYLIRVQASDKLADSYLSYFFQSPLYWKQIMSGIEGGAQGGFNSTKLGQLNVPMPGLPEQSRIADLLGSIDTKLNLNKQLRTKQKQLKQSLLQDLLAGKVSA